MPKIESSSSPPLRALTIGIIGFGPFGQFLSKTMIKQGHTVIATSQTDYSQLCSHLGISFSRNTHEFLEVELDVVLLSTSILSFSNVVKSIPFCCLNRPTLFVDVLSVKEHPKEVLLQVMPVEFDVLCTHPMFGPVSGRDGWSGLNFMYDRVRIRNEGICSSFLQIFKKEGCNMLEMSCQEHDRLAARSQFVTHTIGRVLAEMDIQSTSINTKNFETLVQLKESTTKDSFDLFSGLFKFNKYAREEKIRYYMIFLICENNVMINLIQLKTLGNALEMVKQRLENINEERVE